MLKQCMYYPRILAHSFNFGSEVKIILVCEMCGYHNSSHKDLSLLGFYAMSIGK